MILEFYCTYSNLTAKCSKSQISFLNRIIIQIMWEWRLSPKTPMETGGFISAVYVYVHVASASAITIAFTGAHQSPPSLWSVAVRSVSGALRWRVSNTNKVSIFSNSYTIWPTNTVSVGWIEDDGFERSSLVSQIRQIVSRVCNFSSYRPIHTMCKNNHTAHTH